MNRYVYLPVENLAFKDLYDWSIPLERCKKSSVTLSPSKLLASPRKNHGVAVLRNGDKKESGTLTHTNEKDVALFRINKQVFAVKEECPHAGGPLHLGDIEDMGDKQYTITCPWHGWKIDLDTGKVISPQGHDLQSTVTYPVKVTDTGKLYIGFDCIDQKYFDVYENDF